MPQANLTILSIETSFDDTAASVVRNGTAVLSNVLSSQIPLHARYGGVIPEIAARAHTESMTMVISNALTEAWPSEDPRQSLKTNIDMIAVTHGPGLIGSLLVGVSTARSLAYTFNKPLIPVHHILGHVYSNFLVPDQEATVKSEKLKVESSSALDIRHSSFSLFPFLTLVASGGHTELILSTSHHHHTIIARTRDDAAGEAFDKAAALLDLPYPGGPSISASALQGDPQKYALPRGMHTKTSLDFSFSGLKTALAQLIQKLRLENVDTAQAAPDLAASFQASVVESLVSKTMRAAAKYNVRHVALAGGVAANNSLRKSLQKASREQHLPCFVPDFAYCTDNAAMIGAAAYFGAHSHSLASTSFPWYNVNVEREPLLELQAQ